MSTYDERQAARKRDLIPAPRQLGEKWRPWPRLNDYFVSSKAGPDRCVRRKVGRRWRYLKANGSGPYPSISFYLDGKRTPFRLHIVVAETWLPPKPFAGAMVLHRDDDAANCAASNLRWGTRRDNHDDAVRNGRIKGLGRETALFIRDNYERTPGRIKEAAQRFGVTPQSIAMLLNGKTYRESAPHA